MMTKAFTAGAGPRWRANLKRLPQDFPQLRSHQAESEDYRSTSAILRAANHVIGPEPQAVSQNPVQRAGRGRTRARADLRCRRARGRTRRGPRSVLALKAASKKTRPRRGKTLPSSTAPTTRPSPFEKALRKASIPYKVSGGTGFRPGRDRRRLCAWFRLWSNNDDDPAFARHHHAAPGRWPHHPGQS